MSTHPTSIPTTAGQDARGRPSVIRARHRSGSKAFVAAALGLAALAGCRPGSLDPGWSEDGISASFHGSNRAAAALLDAGGGTVVAGTGQLDDDTPGQNAVWLGRYAADGSIDAAFGNGGITRLDVTAGNEVVRAVAAGPDGSLVVVGYADGSEPGDESDLFVIRTSATGVPDPTFGTGGVLRLDLTDHDRAGGVAVRGDQILVAASLDHGGSWANQWTVVALDATGAVDPTFGTAGRAVVPTALLHTFDGVQDLAVAPDGDLLLGGIQGSSFAVARLTPGGALDASWDGDGVTVAPVANGGQAFDLAVQPDGKVVLAGFARPGGARSDEDLAVVRWTATGVPDASFGANGRVVLDAGAQVNDRALAVAVARDHKIVLAGMTHAAGGMDALLVRLDHDGSPDLGFGDAGLRRVDTHVGANEQLEALVVTSTDRTIGIGWNLTGWSLVAVRGGAAHHVSGSVVQVHEGTVGPATCQMTVTLSAAVDHPVTARWATADDTAAAPYDYLPASGTVTFPAGTTTATVTVAVVKDSLPESDEGFLVQLSHPTDAGTAQAGRCVIVDDDRVVEP